jgi:DNA adenine methylase
MGVPKQMPNVGGTTRAGTRSGLTSNCGIQAYRNRTHYTMSERLKAPLPYPGGKSTIADEVWRRLGDTPNYVEAFMGSAAVLLARPHDLDGKTETANDLDGFLTNSLRAIAYDPEATAYWCDRPVNECDLTAFHLWLKAQREDLTERLFADPFYFDPVVAGAYLWGAASWIGDGWCVADGPWINRDGRLVDRRTLPSQDTEGVPKQMPMVNGARHTPDMDIQAYRASVPRKMPEVGRSPNGQIGFNRKGIQALRYQGVPRKMPEVDHGRGVTAAPYADNSALLSYFSRLQARLRRVRLLCGDWRRVVKPSVTVNHGLTALFLDPPYPSAEHDMGYHGDNDIWWDVARWAVENGDNKQLRIAVCGYFSEASDAVFPPSWTRYRWEARGGYSNQSKDGRGRENAKRECVWFSPHCIDPSQDYNGTLFEGLL